MGGVDSIRDKQRQFIDSQIYSLRRVRCRISFSKLCEDLHRARKTSSLFFGTKISSILDTLQSHSSANHILKFKNGINLWNSTHLCNYYFQEALYLMLTYLDDDLCSCCQFVVTWNQVTGLIVDVDQIGKLAAGGILICWRVLPPL